MDSKLNISQEIEDHRGTSTNLLDRPNTEAIASVANELKDIGDNLNSQYKLSFVNKMNLARALSSVVSKSFLGIFVIIIKL